MIWSARIAILDPVLLTILNKIPHLDCVSNVSHCIVFEEQCNQNYEVLLPGLFWNGFRAVQRAVRRLMSFSFPTGIIPLPNMD